MFSASAKPIAWPLFGYFFFLCTLIGTMMPYLSVYYKYIGLTGSEIGYLMSLITLATIVVPHFWGWLTSVLRKPKLVLQIATGGAFFAILPLNFFFEFNNLWFFTFILALFYSALTPLADSLAVRSIRSLNVPYTRVRVGGSIGYIAAVTLCGFLLGHFEPSVVVIMMSVFMGCAFAITFTLKEKVIETDTSKVSGSFMDLLRSTEIRFFLLLAFLSYMAHAPFNVFFAVHLGNAGYTGEQIGLLIAFGVIIEIILFLFFGHILKQFSVVYVVAACFAFGAVRWFLVGWFAEFLWIVLFTQLMHCLTFAVFHMVSIEQVHRLFPEKFAAQGQAMYSAMAIGLGGGIGMVIAGYVWEWAGGAWTYTFAAVISLIAFVLLMIKQMR